MEKMQVLATDCMASRIMNQARSPPSKPAYSRSSARSASFASSFHQPAVVLLSCVPARSGQPQSLLVQGGVE